MQKSKPSIVVLISGRGSNLSAILEFAKQTGAYTVSAVISNKPDAAGLAFAASEGIQTSAVDHRTFGSREEFDACLRERIESFEPDLVVLAGFMRVLTEGFVQAFNGRLVNIHPSLLPAFPGLKTHEQALAAGVRLHGATVHLVTPQLDHGPILDQAAVAVLPDDTPSTLASRVLALEHQIYPRAIARWLAGELQFDGATVRGALSAPLCYAFPNVESV